MFNLVREVGPKRKRKRILDDISLSVYPKEFIALVGTSGAGKSTLMKAMNGCSKADSGTAMVNGDNPYEMFDLYRTMIGYVPQDDILHRELTVAAALRYAAELRLPPDTTAAERAERVRVVLEQVEMAGHENTPISRLSGGQRKRVSIAVELLADPHLFFLDEPTSGLDPGLEKKMMYTLRKLADSGRTIVLVTHATANINQCDHVCFLSRGRLVYYGPPREAKNFFKVQSDDFADIYEELDTGVPKETEQKSLDWEKRYEESKYHKEYVVERQQTLKQQRPRTQDQKIYGASANPLRQFSILTRRYLNLVFHDKILRLILLGIMPLLGLLLLVIAKPDSLVGNTQAWIESDLYAQLAEGKQSVSYMIANKTQSLLFLFSLAGVLLGLFAAAFEIVKESSIYERERMMTLRIFPYVASKVVVLGAFAVIQVLMLFLVVSLKVDFDLPLNGVVIPYAPLEMYITLLLATFAAILLGLFISTIVPNVNTGIYVLLFILFFQIIFAGAFFSLQGASLKISNLTLTRWTIEGMGASVNLDGINDLSQTLLKPDPVSQVVEMDVERPSEDWEPVTIITDTQACQVQIAPGVYREMTIPVIKEVRENELITVTETMSDTVTVTPDPIMIQTPREFDISFKRSESHMVTVWVILILNTIIFWALTMFALKRKDVI